MLALLAIDTSTKNFSLAVSEGERILRYRNIRRQRVLSSSIIPGIQRILSDAGVAFNALDAFAVGLGPGSFTSLRVGLATVKGLAFATRTPIVGIPSLDVIAHGVMKETHKDICVLSDAKRNLVYACVYKKAQQSIIRKTDYLLVPITELLAIIHNHTLFVGDAVPLYKDIILRWRQHQGQKKEASFNHECAPERFWYPQARFLVSLALARVKKKKFDNIHTLVPLYLYPHDCQVRKQERQ